MADTMEKPEKNIQEEEEEELSFEELGLDPRLTRALLKKGIQKPTPIQHVAIPLVLVSLSQNCLRGSSFTFRLITLFLFLFFGNFREARTWLLGQRLAQGRPLLILSRCFKSSSLILLLLLSSPRELSFSYPHESFVTKSVSLSNFMYFLGVFLRLKIIYT